LTSLRLEKLFNLYAANWQALKVMEPSLRIDPDPVEDIVLCPLCFKYFTREDIGNKQLSEEHVPPEKLGGKVRTLTCKECNNNSGRILDIALIKFLRTKSFVEQDPEMKFDTKIFIEDPRSPVRVNLNYSENGALVMVPIPEASHPGTLNEIHQQFVSGHGNFRMFPPVISSEEMRRADIALIRIAYLWAFSCFGYGFLLSSSWPPIRDQMANPGLEILPTLGILRENLADGMLGVNVIKEPKELRSYLVVFDLKVSRGSILRYGVILPAPVEPGLKIYQELINHAGKPIDFTYMNLHKPIDIVQMPMLAHQLWNAL
jgi:hypothetical protein